MLGACIGRSPELHCPDESLTGRHERPDSRRHRGPLHLELPTAEAARSRTPSRNSSAPSQPTVKQRIRQLRSADAYRAAPRTPFSSVSLDRSLAPLARSQSPLIARQLDVDSSTALSLLTTTTTVCLPSVSPTERRRDAAAAITMDFAPYQSSPPEHGRTLSPLQDSTSPRTSLDARANPWAQRATQASPPPLHHPQPQRAWSGDSIQGGDSYQSPNAAGFGAGMGDYFSGLGARQGMVSEFDTTLGIRLDYEACLAYLAVPPIGAILLLILEHKSDYVRYVDPGRMVLWIPRLE